MKFRTAVVIAGAAAVGYLLGTQAGRERYEQIKARAGELARDPRVQSGVSTAAGELRKNAHLLPDPVAGVVRTAAEKVETATKQASDPFSPTSPTSPTSSTPPMSATISPTSPPATDPLPPTTDPLR